MLRIKDEILVLRGLAVAGVPLLMIVFSVAVPALRNPLFLLIGALFGLFLPGWWRSGSTIGRIALVAGLVLAAIYLVLIVVLLRA